MSGLETAPTSGAAAPGAAEPGPRSGAPAPPPDERARLFVALELPEPAREALVHWGSAVLSNFRGLRPVRAENLHATLCFLGSRRTAEIEAIAGACGAVAGEPAVESGFAEPVWLPPRRPRVLAVRLADDDGALARVQAALSSALVGGGWYAPEPRPFLGHVTVARVGRDVRIRPAELPAAPAVEVRCSRVTLYRSRLGSGGARYESLSVVELGSAPGAADPLSVVRRFHEEQARMYAGGSIDAVRALLADDVVWHVPGASAIAGEHRGVDAVLEYFARRRDMMDGTFRVAVHGASPIAGRVVQLAGGRAVRRGEEVSWETVGVFRVAGGRIAEGWLIPFDQAAFDRIWS
ncbi:MAG: RNA 2',3'-cyclic phosphodiesterase [Solirubrobacterales bacterium]|nr:RNA 2',3'-cyclic phosphodiesterase [Solirubrobacterales bacterium]